MEIAMGEEKEKKNNKIALKILLPVVIVAVIIVIGVTKSTEKQEQAAEPATASSTSAQEKSVDESNLDFVLESESIDLEQLKSYGLPIMIDFGADSCIPCKEMAPVLRELNEEWQGKIIVKFVDVWKYQDGAADFPVQVIPTQFFFDADGNPYVPADPEASQMTMYLLEETEEHVYTAHQGGMTKEMIEAVFEEMGAK